MHQQTTALISGKTNFVTPCPLSFAEAKGLSGDFNVRVETQRIRSLLGERCDLSARLTYNRDKLLKFRAENSPFLSRTRLWKSYRSTTELFIALYRNCMYQMCVNLLKALHLHAHGGGRMYCEPPTSSKMTRVFDKRVQSRFLFRLFIVEVGRDPSWASHVSIWRKRTCMA